ncbi:hypothetical protein CVT26_006336 [Gymnopilus dilepis]|uniref:F-box domain-containing protein n=1 Tax=Gymnopilus dilepis TaxID=231916 RepID=A0A409Y0J3_9AGAR|nr:hypothetical protein CVT26_006336 [Gymnopilus dilepis]
MAMSLLLPSTRALAAREILRAIVSRALEERISFPFRQDIRQQLMLVSRKWNAIVLSKEFWSSYEFVAVPFTDGNHQLDVLRRFIARSGSELLTFRFLPDFNRLQADPNNPSMYFGAGTIDILRDIILPYAARIRSLQCLLPTSQVVRIMRGIPEGALRSLEVADFACIHNFFHPRSLVSAQHVSRGLGVFKSLPRLKSIRLYINSSIRILDLWLLSLPRLTKLDVGNFVLAPDIFMGIMAGLKEDLRVGLFTVQLDMQSCYLEHLVGKVTMSSLEILLIRYIDLFHWPTFPMLLLLPVAQEVRIERADRIANVDWNVSMYTTIFLASSNTLRELVLSTYPFRLSASPVHDRSKRRRTSYTELENLLRVLPNLVRIALPPEIYIHVETSFKLARRQLLPKCQDFQIATDVDPGIILAMVGSRNMSADPTPSNLTRITRLTLTLPLTYAANAQDIRNAMSFFGLTQASFALHYIGTCPGGKGHCCFGL